MVQYRICPGAHIWDVDKPVEDMDEHLSLLVARHVPTLVIQVHDKDKRWLDDQMRSAFGLKQEAHLCWNRDRSRLSAMK